MQVEQVDFLSVPTRDIERAVTWYSDVFGLPASEHTKGEVMVILHRRYKPRG